MKKLFSILFLAAFVASTFAQLPLSTKVKSIGPVSENGLTIAINTSLADTLKGGDTLFYKVITNHAFAVYPYLSLIEKQAGTRDTTALLTFWQSVDGSHNWVQVLNTTSPTAWSTTLAKATKTDVDFWRSVGWFSSTYLGIRLISTGSSSSTYKNIYYGSIRINKQ